MTVPDTCKDSHMAKTSRIKRALILCTKESICLLCSIGTNLWPNGRYRRVLSKREKKTHAVTYKPVGGGSKELCTVCIRDCARCARKQKSSNHVTRSPLFGSFLVVFETKWHSPLRARPSSADAWRGSVGFQSASAGRLLLPSSDGAFCSPGLLCPFSGWSLPPRRPSSIWPWIWPCQARLDFHSPSPCARAPIPPLLRPSSWSPALLELRAPRRSPSDGEWPQRSSGWISLAGFILKSDSMGSLAWLEGLLLELMTPDPPPTPTGRVWPFFT